MEKNRSRVIWIDKHMVKFWRQIQNIVFDWDYSWMPYLELIQEKASKVQWMLSRIAIATWGVKPEIRKAVYSALAERVVLYQAPILVL